MEIFRAIIQLLGGLAMFLYGIEVMGDGLKNSSGAALKRILEKVTGSVIMGVLTGALVTAVIQSSTATIVLTVALIGAGVMTLKQAVSVVMGANIGTTITAQIIRLSSIEAGDSLLLTLFDTDTLAPIALVIGIILLMFVKRKSSKTIGDIFVGFGVLFVGLSLMTDGVKPLIGTDAFTAFVGILSNPLAGIAVGLILTVIVQSSSATVGMLQTVASVPGSGITFAMAYPVIMGINLGTCVTTAMVCSIGASKDAKRTGVVHIVFNTIGTILFMLVLTILQRLSVFGSAYWIREVNSGVIANFQTLFNLLTAVVLIPFADWMVQFSMVVIKDDGPEEDPYPELHTLDEKLYISPAVAVSEAVKAVAAVGELARSNFEKGCRVLQKYDPMLVAQVNTDEDAIDQFTDHADHFLIGLSKNVENEWDDRQLDMLMQTLPNFERIGDYATNLVELAERLQAENTAFSEIARKELEIICGAVNNILSLTVRAFSSGDNTAAMKIEPLEETIDDMVLILRDHHTKRLKNGTCSVGSGLVFMETLTYLERASDQCSSIAVMMLARNNKEILQNHYDYLKKIHSGGDAGYLRERDRRREQYIIPLKKLV